MRQYNWQQADWPHFRYDLTSIHEILISIAEKMGLIYGKLSHLKENLQMEATIDLMIEEAIKTSEIEGEYINRPDIRSSIKNRLGLNPERVPVKDKRAQGLAELMIDARHTFKDPLTETMLFEWHLMLLSSSFNPNLKIATWRTDEEPMQIVSNRHGKWLVHFEGPPSHDVPKEMEKFLDWFNSTAPGSSQAIKFAPVRAAIAHLYFESIHPFEDGNGRIGRVIAEKALSQGFGYPVMLSLSDAILAEKKTYYKALSTASKSNEITEWIQYFANVILSAQIKVEEQINFILKKSKFFDAFKDILNERQLKVIKRMLAAGVKGFEGGMSTKKYMVITGASKATATRDLQQLYALRAVTQVGAGRSIRYELNFNHASQD